MPQFMFSKGLSIKRYLDELIFLAEIVSVDNRNKLLTIKYYDDNNIEENVPFDEVELIDNDKNNIIINSNSNSDKNLLLSKPLAGLVDDDYEIRKNHKPSIIIHNSADDSEAIILNGAENKLAAGGGLRALRYLRK